MKQFLTFGIMLLFIGMAFTPTTGFYLDEQFNLINLNRGTLYVGGTGSGNYSTIQEAINNASDGDTVFVYSGTYSETIFINTTIDLIGENRISTTINGSEDGSVITINADHVNLSGFTIRNSGTSLYDAGVEVHSDYNHISKNRMVINSLGIYLIGSNYNIISENNFYYNWVGICVENSDNNIILDNNCTDNDLAMTFYDGSNYNNITDNQVIMNGDGILLGNDGDNNNVTINSIFYSERGIRSLSSGNIISNNIISWCSVIGLYLSRSSNNNIYGNGITNSTYHGIWVSSGSDSNSISNNDISGNSKGIFIQLNSNHNIIFENNFSSNFYGIQIYQQPEPSDYNIIINNNFFSNQNNVHDGCNSTWDDGYPNGGNYLDDYSGYDNYSGPNQDQPGSDGIGDTPRNIPGGGGGTDWYPLMYPWGEQRPVANFTYLFVNGGYIIDGSSSYDRDGEIVLFEWDFGDGETGQGMITTHGYNESGTYDVTLTVSDDDSYQGEYALGIDAVENQRPSAPLIDGPTEAKAGKSHFYNFTSEDPEGADVSYYVDWGDDRVEPWSDFISSGDTYRTAHGWSRGTYTIRCKSKDIYGAISDWSELEVTMPNNQQININTVENERYLKSVDNSEEILYVETIWYSYWAVGPIGAGFYAYGPGIDTRFREWEGSGFFSAGTWTNDGRFLCCMYENGTLYDIDPKTFDVTVIGDGGSGLNGLAYDPVNEELYGASSYDLYEIDIETGEQEYIGAFGGSVNLMIAIAFDQDGVLYGWDLGDKLWIIDLDWGDAELVGSLGINLNYAQDGAFDLYNDILYLAAYTLSGPYLYECDEDTGECTLIDAINPYLHPTAWAISYELKIDPPVTNISFDPPDGGDNGWHVSDVTVSLNASDNTGVIVTYYRINDGEWQTYESSFIISKEGYNLVEYYSVDYVGNIEDVKSSTVNIDKTLPDIEETIWATYKEGGDWYVTFNCNATDEMSKMHRAELFINDELHKIVEGIGPIYEFTIPWSKFLKTATFKFIFYDFAGNHANATINGSDINSIDMSVIPTESNEELSTGLMADDNTIIVEFGGNETFSGDRVIEIDMDGNIVWEFGGIDKPHDVERLPNGNTLITVYVEQRVIEVNSGGTIVWEMTGLTEPMDAERLPNGNTLITEYANNRVIEIESDGTIVWEKDGLRRPFDAERLNNGNTLISQTWPNGSVIEVNSAGDIVWEKDGLDAPVDAERLANGNTLITEHIGKKVSEVDIDGNEVWNKTDLYVPKDAERLANGNTLIAECGANRVIEVNSSGTIKWLKSDLFYPTDAERLGQAPGAPSITGETNGTVKTEYEYTINVIDPDWDNVRYKIEWGDDTDTDWFGPYESGKDVNVKHEWNKEGTYEIRVWAKDVFDNVGTEYGTLTVTMPKNQNMQFGWLERFPLLQRLQSFPLLNRLLLH